MLRRITFRYFKRFWYLMVQKFLNLLVLEEAGTETVSPVLKAYGLVCGTRGTKFRSRSEEE